MGSGLCFTDIFHVSATKEFSVYNRTHAPKIECFCLFVYKIECFDFMIIVNQFVRSEVQGGSV